MKKTRFVIEKGEVKAIYTPELKPYAEQIGAEVRRASRVEPNVWLLRWVFRLIRMCVSDNSWVAAMTRKFPCRWRSNLKLSGGPILGPFKSRNAAIEAEKEWLTKNWLQL